MYKKLFNTNPSATCTYIVNVGISILVLALCSPIMVLISIAIKCQDGGSVLYRGERYGYKKNKFVIYKFRTLVPNAEKLIGARLLRPGEGFETLLGKFLRETRLDELPQLFNIINGSMVFIGPRPERQSVYEEICREIKEYDKRFNVKPGVFGYSQLFTPHSTDKRMRAYIDNYYAKRKDYGSEIRLIIYGFFIMGIALLRKAFKVILNKTRMFFYVHRINSVRRLERYDCNNSEAKIWYSVNSDINKIGARADLKDPDVKVSIVNMNIETILVEANQPISFADIDGNAVIRIFIKNSNVLSCNKKNKTAYCKLTKCIQVSGSNRYLLYYKSISSLNKYKVDKYLLKRSVA